MKKFLSILLALTAVLALCSCGKKNPQIAQLTLDSNPTTGYSWEAFQSSDLFEISSEYTADSQDTNLVGGGGKECFTLKPLKSGSCEVSFVYYRPSDGVEWSDTYVYNITVSDDMQITVESGTAQLEGTGDIPPEVPELVITEAK